MARTGDAIDASAASAALHSHYLLHSHHLHYSHGRIMLSSMDTATADDHDYELTRYDDDANPVSVWVRVTHFAPAERQTWDHPGAGSEIEASGWNSNEQPVELDDNDLAALASFIENPEPDVDEWDAYAA